VATDLEAAFPVPASILLSLDSLIASMAMVMLGLPVQRAYRLALAFLISDGIATWVGLSVRGPFGPALFCAYFALLIGILVRSPFRAAFWVPALFSLDNLFAGIVAQPGHWFDPLATAFASGLLALAGVAIGAIVLRYASHRRLFGAGLILLVVVVFW
jgi:hypothetical protein